MMRLSSLTSLIVSRPLVLRFAFNTSDLDHGERDDYIHFLLGI